MRPKVLIIDDELDLGEILSFHLESDFDSDISTSLDSATKRLSGGAYDLVLCDLIVPGCRISDVLDEVRRLQPNVPVVVMTGYGRNSPEVEKVFQLGVTDHLQKPFPPTEELKAFLRSHLKK